MLGVKKDNSTKYDENTLLQTIKRYELILRSAGEGIYEIDTEGKTCFVNPSAAKMLGWDSSELIGRSAYTTLFQAENENQLELCPIQFALEDGEVSHVQTETFYRHDNSQFLVEYICVPLKEDDKVVGAVLTFQDITERRELEKAIAQARDFALQSAKLKANFLANMSHEIRTPLNGVIGLTELLLHANLDQSSRHYTEMIKDNAGLLLDIVNDILDFSKIEAGKFLLENIDFDLNQIIAETIEFFSPQARHKKLTLTSVVYQNVPAVLHGDAGRLRQVFNNLLNNALKFTAHGEITLHVAKESEADGEALLRFSLSDTGIGIASEARAHLFQPFTQADASTTRRFGGTGLGLAICKEIVEMMGGEIGVESVPGQGSTFWFTAKFTIAAPNSETTEQLEVQHPITEIHQTKTGNLTEILVAEDNPVNQEVAVGLLAQLGYRVDVAANGHEALQALQKKDYDLIFMDCQMPELDGYEATAEIRRLEQNRKHTKIIALTAYAATKEAIEKCLAAGMDDYLSKPFSKDSLNNILAKHSEKKSSQVLDTKAKFGQHPLTEVLESEALRRLFEIESSGDHDFVKETLNLYLNHAEKCLSEMKTAAAQQNFSGLKRSAHSLKGSSGSVGAKTIFDLCNKIEYYPEKTENKEIETSLQTLEQEFMSLKQSITEFQKHDESPN